MVIMSILFSMPYVNDYEYCYPVRLNLVCFHRQGHVREISSFACQSPAHDTLLATAELPFLPLLC